MLHNWKKILKNWQFSRKIRTRKIPCFLKFTFYTNYRKNLINLFYLCIMKYYFIYNIKYFFHSCQNNLCLDVNIDVTKLVSQLIMWKIMNVKGIRLIFVPYARLIVIKKHNFNENWSLLNKIELIFRIVTLRIFGIKIISSDTRP